MSETRAPAERGASWLELFFDLVVVAAIVQLAHLLHGHAVHGEDVLRFALLYFAIWQTWAAFTLYSNVAAESTRRRTMFVGMGGIAVMAAAVPGAFSEHAEVFAVAYVVTRIVSSNVWQHRGQLLAAWPLAHFGGGLVPWIVSLWTDGPTKYVLWAIGLGIDLVATVLLGPERFERGLSHRARRQERRERRHGRRAMPRLKVAEVEQPHLVERMGLFVIIVLGEGVLQMVRTAEEADWDLELAVAGFAGFLLLIALWWQTFQYGFGRASDTRRINLTMVVHFVMTATITMIAAGLGGTVGAPGRPLDPGLLWVLCGAVAVYAGASTLLSVRPRYWAAGALVVAAALVLGALGGELRAWAVAVAVTVVMLAQVGLLAMTRLRTD
ncbi:low temperature requirement protein A [Prauserella cavernicola]|uniref:Low temperature requirement protein A n=1 Tax=Prauserella cavernicola TaxID=2800127 RepID=A0A934V4I8_9PSEU|nr:low temperature requirement protein A [Prauserella cavernicola]MBK1783628.1 low temperature requirement protein A [Prauserella cavernicola]